MADNTNPNLVRASQVIPTGSSVKVIAGSGNDRISVDVSALLASAPQTQIDVVGGAGVWPPLLSTAQAFALIDPRLREVARCLGLSRSAFVFKIGLPSMTHDVVGALRVSISLALILTVLGEMLSAQDGLGYVILLAARSFNAPRLYAAIILLALLGASANLIILLAERRLMAWNIHRV